MPARIAGERDLVVSHPWERFRGRKLKAELKKKQEKKKKEKKGFPTGAERKKDRRKKKSEFRSLVLTFLSRLDNKSALPSSGPIGI